MTFLSRAAILAAQDLRTEDVDVPEWGGVVRISEMTGAQRDAWEQSLLSKDKGGVNMINLRARLVAFTALGEDGKPLFTAEDVAALGQKSGTALDRLVAVARRLNKIGAEELESARGNSPAAPSGSSTSG